MADRGTDLVSCPLQQVDIWTEAGRPALSRVLGFDVPEAPGHVVHHEGLRVARLSSRRFWIVGALPLVALPPEDGTSLRLEQGRVSLTLAAGSDRHLLAQLMAIDWDAPHAAPGRIVLSAIHKVPVAVLPQDDGTFELIVPRSFAESITSLIGELA